jgi:death on curing protein
MSLRSRACTPKLLPEVTHAFADANKRTALVSALAYLVVEGFLVSRTQALEEIMVDVAQGQLNYLDLANIFSSLAIPAPDAPA